MNIVRKLLVALILLSSLFTVGQLVVAPQTVHAQAREAVCDSLGGCNQQTGERGITGVIRIVLNILSFAAGVIAVIMIVIGGLKFITSQGDSGAVSSARNTILYALIGIVIVLLSQGIVQFVLKEATTAPAVQQDPPTQPSGPR